MKKLKVIIQQLGEEEFHELVAQLKETRAKKYFSLLKCYREANHSEQEIARKLAVTKTAYHTLKSRLYHKVQDFLFEKLEPPRIHILGNVANIHTLIYNTPRDTAIAILKKLERELIRYDMPNELTIVYSALKRMHVTTPKLYEYSQLYNRNLAFMVSLDSSRDLLFRFTKALGQYLASRNPKMIELFVLMKSEMNNLFKVYESHHLTLYKNIFNISFALFVPAPASEDSEETIERMLAESWKIIADNPIDLNYKYLQLVIDFLAFEYYHGLKLVPDSTPYFVKVNSQLDTFLLADHCCVVTQFLFSKAERYAELGKGPELEEENRKMLSEINKEDAPDYINLMLYHAVSLFYGRRYSDAAVILNKLLQGLGLKNYGHAEMEIKLFLAFNYVLLKKPENAEILLLSLARKQNGSEEAKYKNTRELTKILKLLTGSRYTAKVTEEKVRQLRDSHYMNNVGEYRVLHFLKLNDDLIVELSNSGPRVKG